MRLHKLLRNTDGSSMISVLVAFIILLIGIAGFGRAVQTANDMVRRAEMLNAATGEMLKTYFYPDYVAQTSGSSYVLNVREVDGSGDSATIGSDAFKLHGRLRTREYKMTITPSDEKEEPTDITYQMYYYK